MWELSTLRLAGLRLRGFSLLARPRWNGFQPISPMTCLHLELCRVFRLHPILDPAPWPSQRSTRISPSLMGRQRDLWRPLCLSPIASLFSVPPSSGYTFADGGPWVRVHSPKPASHTFPPNKPLPSCFRVYQEGRFATRMPSRHLRHGQIGRA